MGNHRRAGEERAGGKVALNCLKQTNVTVFSSSSSQHMDSEVGPTTSASPPHESVSSPVGSPDAEIHAPLSDEEHGHDHEDDDDDDDNDQPSDNAVNKSEDLKRRIIRQVEYYLSDENLPTDKHMIGLIKKHKEGYVPISIIAAFRKMKKLSRDHSFIVEALRESTFLVVSSDGKKVKRLHPFPLSEVKDPKLFTVIVENLPEDHSVENIWKIFGEAGKIRHVTIHDPLAPDRSKKGSKNDVLISSKLHALVEFDTIEAAEKAVATLNDEQDWRNGLRVKQLKHTGKYRPRKAWRDVDDERHGTGRMPNQTANEEHHNRHEHHDDTPDEEEGEHAKEKHGQRGCNRGRSRRNKYHSTNGLGHGTTSSAHAIEHSKPPPGPKMPDGTRGFTMGRGRPPVSI